MEGRHLLPLRGESDLRDPRPSRSDGCGVHAGTPRGHEERAFRRITFHHPSSPFLSEHRVVAQDPTFEELLQSGVSRQIRDPTTGQTVPVGLKPSPITSYSTVPVTKTRTFISPFVSVPVLSEQITEAAPRASTAGSFRISAPRRIIRWSPNARLIVTIAGSPSGIAATESPTAVRKRSSM